MIYVCMYAHIYIYMYMCIYIYIYVCIGFLEIPYTRFDVDLYIQHDDQQAAVASGKSYCRRQGCDA